MNRNLLEIRGLQTSFHTEDGVVAAVNGVDLDVAIGETLAIVGESGCGKSVAALSVMRLIPDPPGKITDGTIRFDGKDLLALSDAEMRKIRGNDISMIFQEPMTSLNPVYTIGDQIMEAIALHQNLNKRETRDLAIEMLKQVGIPSPELRIDDYPHHLSGGMRQRVMIAMALSCNPRLLIADEPTTALDVTVQAQILDLMNRLQEELGTSIILITHDLGVVAETAQKVAVMYMGKVVEKASVDDLFSTPLHPYTIGLLRSTPKIEETRERLEEIKGVVPNPFHMPTGCSFRPRCDRATDACGRAQPEMREIKRGHWVQCWNVGP